MRPIFEIFMLQPSNNRLRLTAAASLMLCVTPLFADGLGGLAAVRAMFLIWFVVFALSGGVLALNLIFTDWSGSGEHNEKHRWLLILSVIYLLAGSPLFAWFLISP